MAWQNVCKRPLGSSAGRSVAANTTPDVPIVAESLPGYEAVGWLGVGAPQNTPTEIINRLNREINAGLADPIIRERLAVGGTVIIGSPGDARKLIADEIAKWAKVTKFANIKPE